MKKTLFMGAALVMAMTMTSCKSGESAYKKAYEKAQAQSAQQAAAAQQTAAAATQQTVPAQKITPAQAVTPVQTATDPSTVKVTTESVKLISGSGLKDYSVVVGSFSNQDNATRLQSTLKGQGYDAQVVQSPSNMYRVIISTFADKASAVASRDKVRATYDGAWLLYNK